MGKEIRIVILGAGYGGVDAAKILGKKFKKNADVHITLIDRNPYHTLMTELHEIAGSRTTPQAVQISLDKIFASHKSKVVVDEITAIDFEKQTLKSKTAEYGYDHLILGTGGSPEFFGTPGVQENSYTLWSLEDAIRIRENVELRFRDAAAEPDPERRKRLLTFAVAGAGFTGIELAGELLDRAEVLCPRYHIHREEVRILIIEAKDAVLPILPEKLRIKASKYLEKRGAEILLNSPITKAEGKKIVLANGTVIEADTFVWTCGIQGSEFTGRINLTKGRTSNDKCSIASPEGIHGMAGCHFDEEDQYIVGERGRILVNEYLQSVDRRNVYLIGDMIWYVHEEKVVPQIVENAVQSAHCAASNVIADITGGERHPYKPEYHGFMVSIGSTWGVAHVMGMDLSGIWAMGMKHMINMVHLFGVAGFNAVWGYIKEEFTDVADRRSISRGHLSAKVPAYWVLPARLWLGLMWFVEGINKIGEGWFNFDLGSKSSWMFSPGVIQGGTVDAIAAASEVVEEVIEAEPGAFVPWGFDLSAPILAADNPIVTFFKTTLMDGVMSQLPYQFLQVMVVSMEMAIGLALLGGLFTWGAGVASIGMCMMFTLSGMFNWDQLWFAFMGIAMLGGAGHVAGLDHWVMPWMKKWWNGTTLAQKTYLYDGEPRAKKRGAKS